MPMSDWYFDELTPGVVESLFFRLMRGYKRELSPEMSRFRTGGTHSAVPVLFSVGALGPYLAPGERSSVVEDEGEMLPLDRFFVQAVENGTDPHHAGYWNIAICRQTEDFPEQAASVAMGACLARSLLLRRMNNQGIQNLEQWLESAARVKVRKPSYHQLAHALNHASRKALGLRHDEAAVDTALEALQKISFEEGWFAGGRQSRRYDDSISWGYLMLLSMLIYVEGGKRSPHFEFWAPRIRKTLKDFPYLYDPRGGSGEYGERTSAGFSRLAGPVAGYLAGAWPGKPGLLKRMVRLQINRLAADGEFDPETGRLTEAAGDMRRYRILQTLGLLLLCGPKDPFWKAAEEQLPSERGDFVRYIEPPGWLVHGARQDGHVQLINGGSSSDRRRGGAALAARYGKFTYSSRMGFVLSGGKRGLYVCDNTLSASADKEVWSHRDRILSHRLVGERVLFSSSLLDIARSKGRAGQLKVDSVVVPLRSGAQIRIHRVRRRGLGGGVVHLREGGYALGIDGSSPPRTAASGDLARAEGSRGFSLVRILGGYSFAAISQGYEGNSGGHTLAPRYLLPRVEAVLRPGESLYLALFIHGGSNVNLIDTGSSISFSRKGERCSLLSGDKSFFEFDFQSS